MYTEETIENAVNLGFALVRRYGARHTVDAMGETGNVELFARHEMVEVLYPDGHVARKKVNIEVTHDRHGNAHNRAFIRVNVHGMWVRKHLEGLLVRKERAENA